MSVFTDTTSVIALAMGSGECHQPSPFALTVTVQCRHVDLFALRLKDIGCAGLRVTVRTPRPVGAATVAHLARARVCRLAITEPVTAPTVVAWFETAKAAATLGLPLTWHGTLPAEAHRHAGHLPPPRDDDRWLRQWRYGVLGWRRGPGFAEVLDYRRGHRRTLVDLEAVTAIFGAGLDRPSIFHGTVAELVDAGFVMPFRDEVVWLPYRLVAHGRRRTTVEERPKKVTEG